MLPELLHLSQVHLLQAHSLAGCFMLHGLETVAKLLRGASQGRFGINLQEARQTITIKQGIDQANGKKIAALVKDTKLKVDASINGDKLRVSGKKRDDLQMVIALLKKADLPIPVQFENFRD